MIYNERTKTMAKRSTIESLAMHRKYAASGRGVELLGTFKFQVVRESTLVQSHHGIEIVLKPSAHLMLESQFA